MTQVELNLAQALVRTGMSVNEAVEALELDFEWTDITEESAEEYPYWEDEGYPTKEAYESVLEYLREAERHIGEPDFWENYPEYSDIHKDVYGFRPRWY